MKQENLSLEKASIFVNSTINEIPDFYDNLTSTGERQETSVMRTASFSKDKDNLLLWSHYAKSHTGICLEFDASKPPFTESRKIKYLNEFTSFTFDLPLAPYQALRDTLVKSKDWEYENEFRIVRAAKNNGDFFEKIDSKAIKRIYLGVNISESNIKEILAIVRNSTHSPEIFKCSTSKDSFKLVYDTINL